MNFRNLEKNELNCRVQSAGKVGVKLLLYKDARADMEILDETVGPENWQCEYSEQKGILFCKLGIFCRNPLKNDEGTWVWKEDAGSESNQDAEKGCASDAFKRAGFRWGIGRVLYTAPEIFIYEFDNKNEKNAAIYHSEDGKTHKCYDKFTVEKIAYSEDGKRITGLAIRNESLGKRVYVWQDKSKQK